MITTEAWVLHRGTAPYQSTLLTGDFRREPFAFADLEDDEILVEPLLASWEGNMTHAIARSPIDVCQLRKEDSIVVGNSGVVRVLKPHKTSGLRAGDVGVLFGCARLDPLGYALEAHAFDAAHTVGLLAKQTKIRARQFLTLPEGAQFSHAQWAAYGVKYLTAWSNWKIAFGAYRLQVTAEEDPAPHVWGWGGGTTFAELDLARRQGCRVAMLSGNESHLKLMTAAGMTAVDRRRFPHIEYDESRYIADAEYKARYQRSERMLLEIVREHTAGQGVAIFADYIGTPTARVTLKALGRQGVLTTAGWMLGMSTPINRAMACMHRNLHVHTHYARLQDWFDASAFSVASAKPGWMPPVTEVYKWEDIGALAAAAAKGATTYFPVYEVNSL